MALVGDVIMMVRGSAQDPCQTFSPPNPQYGLTSGTLTGQISVQVTWLTPWGETLPSFASNFTLNKQSLTISGWAPPGVTQGKVYYSIGTIVNAYEVFNSSAMPYTIQGLPQGAAPPPTKSSAYNPDTDGGFISQYAMYRWLNTGLSELGRRWGGILDVTGIQSMEGLGFYRAPGEWTKITNMWYDGWPVMPTFRDTMFMWNQVTGIVGYYTQEVNKFNTTVNLWPQPERTGFTTTLASSLAATDISIPVVDVGSYQTYQGFLNMGFAMIGTPTPTEAYQPGYGSQGYEVVYYNNLQSGKNPALINVQRGMGWTNPQVWPAGTPVTELNVRISGKRLPPQIPPGSSLFFMDVPRSWSYLLYLFVLAQFRQMEQDLQSYSMLMKEFATQADKDLDSSQVVGKRQMGEVYGLETMPGGFLGGIIIP